MIEKLSASSLPSSSKELPIQDLQLAKIRLSQKLLLGSILQQHFFCAGLSTFHASWVTNS